MDEIQAGMKPPDDPGAHGGGGGEGASGGDVTVRPPRPKILYEEDFDYEHYKVLVQPVSSNGSNYLSLHKLGQALVNVTQKTTEIIRKERLSRNKVLVVCTNAKCANALVNNEELRKEYNFFIPMNYVTRSAIIRDIDVEFSEEEIFRSLDTRQFKLTGVQRLNRKSIDENRKISYVPSKTLKISFAGQHIPSHVFLWYSKVPCEPFVQSTIQCFNCWKFGHTSKACKCKSVVCKKCYQIEEPEHVCKAVLSCLNCDGMHNPKSKNCPELQRQVNIKALMSSRNMCFQEAAMLIPPSKKAKTFAIKTSNAFSVLEGLEENFPSLVNTNEYDSQAPIDKYVAPPLPYKSTQSQQNNNRTISKAKKRDSKPEYNFNVTKKSRNNVVKEKAENTVAPYFFKLCAERKLEQSQLQSSQDTQSTFSNFSNDARKAAPLSSVQSRLVTAASDVKTISNVSLNNYNTRNNHNYDGEDLMDTFPSSPDLS
ncbi:hypothetical protein M8J77_005711 [Diaphorina citri]|nr:hypothetical protein M8J77_005711 [Diaphorina citri]